MYIIHSETMVNGERGADAQWSSESEQVKVTCCSSVVGSGELVSGLSLATPLW